MLGIGSDKNGNDVKAKIVFARDKNRSRKWLALIFIDVSLSDNEIIRISRKCWDIEVFFKMNKSFLKLAKEFQGRSYNSFVSHTSIVFTRCIMLTLESRKNNDARTIGGFFINAVMNCKISNFVK